MYSTIYIHEPIVLFEDRWQNVDAFYSSRFIYKIDIDACGKLFESIFNIYSYKIHKKLGAYACDTIDIYEGLI